MMSDESVLPWEGGIATSGRGRRISIIAPFAEGEGASMHSATTPISAQRGAPLVRCGRNDIRQTPLLMLSVAITDGPIRFGTNFGVQHKAERVLRGPRATPIAHPWDRQASLNTHERSPYGRSYAGGRAASRGPYRTGVRLRVGAPAESMSQDRGA